MSTTTRYQTLTVAAYYRACLEAARCLVQHRRDADHRSYRSWMMGVQQAEAAFAQVVDADALELIDERSKADVRCFTDFLAEQFQYRRHLRVVLAKMKANEPIRGEYGGPDQVRADLAELDELLTVPQP